MESFALLRSFISCELCTLDAHIFHARRYLTSAVLKSEFSTICFKKKKVIIIIFVNKGYSFSDQDQVCRMLFYYCL